LKDLAKLAGILLGLVFVAGGLFFFTYLGVLLWAPYETALSDPTNKLILAGLDSIFLILIAVSIPIVLRNKTRHNNNSRMQIR
jgi:hypothetical protein